MKRTLITGPQCSGKYALVESLTAGRNAVTATTLNEILDAIESNPIGDTDVIVLDQFSFEPYKQKNFLPVFSPFLTKIPCYIKDLIIVTQTPFDEVKKCFSESRGAEQFFDIVIDIVPQKQKIPAPDEKLQYPFDQFRFGPLWDDLLKSILGAKKTPFSNFNTRLLDNDPTLIAISKLKEKQEELLNAIATMYGHCDQQTKGAVSKHSTHADVLLDLATQQTNEAIQKMVRYRKPQPANTAPQHT